MHGHGGQTKGSADDRQSRGQRQEGLDGAAGGFGADSGSDRLQVGRTAHAVEADQGIEEHGRGHQRQEEVLEARLLAAGIGPLQSQEDVGGNRHQFEPGEQQHQITRHAHQ